MGLKIVAILWTLCLWCTMQQRPKHVPQNHESGKALTTAWDVCKYVNTIANSTSQFGYFAPNICVQDHPFEGRLETNKYECNSSNTDYFVEYYYGHASNCNGIPERTTTYYRSQGFDFECGNQRQDCSAVVKGYTGCNNTGYYADWSEIPYVMGLCFPGNGNPPSIASIEYVCTNTTVTHILYAESGCVNSSNAVNETITNGCDEFNDKYLIETCHMPSAQ